MDLTHPITKTLLLNFLLHPGKVNPSLVTVTLKQLHREVTSNIWRGEVWMGEFLMANHGILREHLMKLPNHPVFGDSLSEFFQDILQVRSYFHKA